MTPAFPNPSTGLKTCFLLLVSTILTLYATSGALAANAPFEGHARVIDGRTLQFGNQTIVLTGVNAFAPAQTCTSREGASYFCGKRAIDDLNVLIAGRLIQCEPLQRLPKELVEARCSVGTIDLSTRIIEDGWALAVHDSIPPIQDAQLRAQATRNGVWSGVFQQPDEWRHDHRRPGEELDEPTTCLIKGAVLGGSTRLWFGPDDPNYDSIQIDPSHGARWFCDPAAAEQAGWIHAAP